MGVQAWSWKRRFEMENGRDGKRRRGLAKSTARIRSTKWHQTTLPNLSQSGFNSMTLFKVPFRYWSRAQHFWLAVATSTALLAALAGGIQWLERHANAQTAELQRLQSELAVARQTPPPTATEQFEKSLPSAQVSEAVARDIAAFAAATNVQLGAIQIENQAGTPSEYATVLYQISAKGEYRQTKQWIAELLGRYATLAVKSLSIQALASEATRQDVRMTLVLYVRD